MARYTVHLATAAKNDLLAIVGWIARDSPGTARTIARRLRERIARLRDLPHRGRQVAELVALGVAGYREISENPWRIIYRIDETNIYVVGVLDSRRNLEDLLLERMMRS